MFIEKKLENLFPIKYLDINSNSKTCKKNPANKKKVLKFLKNLEKILKIFYHNQLNTVPII